MIGELAASPFQSAIHQANAWLADLARQLQTREHHRAYKVLRATLTALREELPLERASALGGALPTLIRGIFYQDWDLAEGASRAPAIPFTERVAQRSGDVGLSGDRAARAIFALLDRRLPTALVGDVVAALPADIAALWPARRRSALDEKTISWGSLPTIG